MWKRTKAKQALIEISPIITSENSTFLCKEEDDKIYIRYTYEWKVIDKKDSNKYLDILGEETLSPDLINYLEDKLKKFKKAK